MSIDAKFRKDLGIDAEAYMNNVIMADDYAVFSVSPSVDLCSGGGIREGSTTLVSGKQKLGKSTFCLQLCANAQNHNDKIKRKVFYVDAENKLEKRDLEGIHNLNLEREFFEPIGSIDGDVIYAESAFKFIENLVKTTKHNIIVLDSISMLLTKAEAAYDTMSDKTFMSNAPRMSAIFMRKMAQLIRPTRNTLLIINHDYANIGAMPGQSKKAESGGTKIQYASNYKFKLTHTKDLKAAATDTNKIGHEVFFKCDYSPLGGTTDQGSFFHLFDYGLDDKLENLEIARQIGLITRKGAWYKFPDGQQAQGQVKARQLLDNDNSLYESIQAGVKEFVTG